MTPFTSLGSGRIDLSDQDILHWVAAEFGVKPPYHPPQVRRVTRQKLSKLYLQNTRNMPRAIAGKSVVDSILGLFIAETNVIYVRAHMSDCRQAAIVAHEVAHFFQVMTLGKLDKWEGLSNEVRAFRELEAREIEIRFQKVFCNKSVAKQRQGAAPSAGDAGAGVTFTLIKR